MAVNQIDTDGAYAFLNKGIKAQDKNKDPGALAMEDFMSLMTAQLKNQDPLKPMESGDFLGQIAAFGTVSGIGDLQKSFEGFAQSMQSDQALQGSALVGRSVLIPSSIGVLNAGDSLQGQINVVEPVTDLKLEIYTESGVPVQTLHLGAASGDTPFVWDGTDDNGQMMPPGVYQFKATGTINGENTAFSTLTVAKVESVLVGNSQQGLTMNLAGIGAVPFKEVQEII